MINTLKKVVKSNSQIERVARQLIGLYPYEKRLSRNFWDFYNFLNATQEYDGNQLKELQFNMLQQIVQHAYDNSKFYHNLYDQYGVKPTDIKSFEDFTNKIPLVTKDMLKDANNITVQYPKMGLITTSGTSGSPFKFYGDFPGFDKELAAIFHQWSRVGFKPGDNRIEMRGFQVEPIIEYPDICVTRFSIVNMEKHIQSMVDYINKNKVYYIHGYPSAIAKFAMLLRSQSLRIQHDLKGILLASENVYDWQVETIKESLNSAPLIAHYGNAERVALGAWCEKNDSYHFLPQYGYLEKGKNAEIIGTGFHNLATPFIRYQMNDVILDWSDEPCPFCKRAYNPIVKRIGGRQEEYLVDEKEEVIPPAVVTFPFKNLHVMKEVQVIQREDKNILLRYVDSSGASINPLLQKDQQELTIGFKTLLGQSIHIEFEKVNEIPLTEACKFKWIISEAVKKGRWWSDEK